MPQRGASELFTLGEVVACGPVYRIRLNEQQFSPDRTSVVVRGVRLPKIGLSPRLDRAMRTPVYVGASIPDASAAASPHVQAFSSAGVDTRRQLDAWEAAIIGLHGNVRFDRSRGAEHAARMKWRREGVVQIVELDTQADALTRSERHTRMDSRSQYELVLPLAGSLTFQQSGSRNVFGPGGLFLMDVSRPLDWVRDSSGSTMLIAFDRSALDGRLPGVSQLCGARLPNDCAVAEALMSYANVLRANLGRLCDHEFKCMATHVLDLTTLLLDGQSDLRGEATATKKALLSRLKRFIHSHLSNGELTMGEVAEANGISRRYMEMLFQPEGRSPREYLLEARLLRAQTMLRQQHRQRSVAEVAYAMGFGSASYFSTAYRRRFGYPPRDEIVRSGR
jgi:AraC-like DNA-binding protein